MVLGGRADCSLHAEKLRNHHQENTSTQYHTNLPLVTFPAASLALVCFPARCGHSSSTLIPWVCDEEDILVRVMRTPPRHGPSTRSKALAEGAASASAATRPSPLCMSTTGRRLYYFRAALGR